MSAGIGELFIELAFKGDAKGADAFKKKVDELAKSMNATVKVSKKATSQSKENIAGLIKGYFAVVGAIKSVTAAYNNLINAMSSNQTWVNLTRQTDLALESLQGYANVASVLDKSLGAEGAAQGIASLEQKLYDLQLTGQGAEGFMYAGINPMGKNAFQIIEELRNRIKGLNNVQASFLLKQMGIDPRMLAMLRMTREEFEALNAELRQYQLTDEQRKAMQKYQEQLSIAAKKIQYFKDKAIVAILPFVVKLTKSFARVVEGISRAVSGAKKFYDGLDKITQTSIKLNAVIAGIIALVLAFMANPVIASFVAILTAIYLIIDDIMVGLQGGDSYFRDFLNWANEFVNNENEPKWMRSLIYILTHIDKLKDILNDYQTHNTEFEENHPYLSKSNLFNYLNKAINAYDAIKGNTKEIPNGNNLLQIVTDKFMNQWFMKGFNQLGSLATAPIYQTNYIQTSETANTVQEELIHAQSINNYGD